LANLSSSNHYDAIIIGGGIAGASIAYALSKRKIKTLLLERREDLSLEASGNPTGLIYPLLTKHQSIEGKFSLAAFKFVLKELENLKESQKIIPIESSVFLIPKSELERDRYLGAISAYSLTKDELEFGYDSYSQREGFYFKKALAISPRHLSKALMDSSSNFTTCQTLTEYTGHEIKEEEIQVTANHTQFHSKLLFLCHSNSILDFPETSWLSIKKVRGQLVWLPVSDELKALPHSYLFGDYLTKDIGHGSVLGASFDEYKMDEDPRESESLSFLKEASFVLPSLRTYLSQLGEKEITNLKTRVSFRSQSQDRRPIFGPLPNQKIFARDMPDLPGPSTRNKPAIPYHKNTFVLGALGSRGLTHSLHASEILVRDALGESNLITEADYSDFKPERFLLRKWKRGN
jgi:tRNA U-34 5-methylaminomethyl-2-thiouridine biosynthesis protein MnmC